MCGASDTSAQPSARGQPGGVTAQHPAGSPDRAKLRELSAFWLGRVNLPLSMQDESVRLRITVNPGPVSSRIHWSGLHNGKGYFSAVTPFIRVLCVMYRKTTASKTRSPI